jgi:hypothetical protein
VWPPSAPDQCITCSGGVQGESNATNALAFPFFYSAQNVYIGVLDSTSAAIGDLPVAKLANPGQPETGLAPSPDSLASALGEASTNTDGTLSPNLATSNPGSYPIPMLSYAAVPTSKGWPGFTAVDGKTLAAFLRYAVGDGQQALSGGSYPLTDALIARTTSVAGQIPTSEPVPRAGGNPHQTGGGGGGANLGGGGGGFGGGGEPSGSGGHQTDGGSPLPAPVPAAFRTPIGDLSSSASSSMLPSMVLALIALLVGPLLWLRSRVPLATPSWRPRRPFGRGDGEGPLT